MISIRNIVARWMWPTALALFFSMGLFCRCANFAAPQGGPRDTIPPKVIMMTPEFATTGFKSNRVYIEFNEYVQINDLMKEFYTSPFMDKKPTVTLRGRGIQIDMKEQLRSDQTYSLNFGSSVSDNNEGNPYVGLRYVFSTGSDIDSLFMSGYTANAYNGDSVANTFIFFYDESLDSVRRSTTHPDYDSTVFTLRPNAVGRSYPSGIFIAENLKPVDYRIYAVQDNNNNQQYEPGVDGIGFLDSTYNPSTMPPFEIWYDSMRMYLQATPQLYFRIFTDKQFKRQYLTGQERPGRQKLFLTFGAKNPRIERFKLEGIDSSQLISEYLTPGRDSVVLWLDVPPEQLPDTIRGEITYYRHDSLNVLVPSTERLQFAWKAFVSRKDRREAEKAEQAAEEGKEEKKPNPFKVTVSASREITPIDELAFTFDYPLRRMDSSRITLRNLRDEEHPADVKFHFWQDTANVRRWVLRAPWAAETPYELLIPEGVFENIAGERNDTLKASFTVLPPDDFASVALNVRGKTPASRYIVQLTDENGRVLREQQGATTGKYTFTYVKPGTVKIRVIEDANGNGRWDAGDMIHRLQPERVAVYITDKEEDVLSLREGREVEVDLDMNRLFAPVTMESLSEELERAYRIKVRKMLEYKEKQRRDALRQQGPGRRQQDQDNTVPAWQQGQGVGTNNSGLNMNGMFNRNR
ncbi:MAG: Ig-like domain-containing protein [Rikenellaceae bacterium]|nr:Ig-like domain-containing protein [Rikenellaceae bacterium]